MNLISEHKSLDVSLLELQSLNKRGDRVAKDIGTKVKYNVHVTRMNVQLPLDCKQFLIDSPLIENCFFKVFLVMVYIEARFNLI